MLDGEQSLSDVVAVLELHSLRLTSKIVTVYVWEFKIE